MSDQSVTETKKEAVASAPLDTVSESSAPDATVKSAIPAKTAKTVKSASQEETKESSATISQEVSSQEGSSAKKTRFSPEKESKDQKSENNTKSAQSSNATNLRNRRKFGRPSRMSRTNRNTSSDDTFDSRNESGNVNNDGISSGNALKEITGYIDLTQDGHAVVRQGFSQTRRDAYLSISVVRKLRLRAGDKVEGVAREPRENDRYWGMKDIYTVNGVSVDSLGRRPRFEEMVPVYPNEKIVLEIGPEPISTRLVDLVAPIGKGQRGLIVAPPKAGKTTIMKEMAAGVAQNLPEAHLMAVLIGERPEEVTDIARHILSITDGKGETAASNFDEPAEEQTRVAEVALERAKRLVEEGKDVVILLDSITRLARAYNLAIPTSGRTLSGGFDPAALYPPKRFFGAARNFEGPGSLTIIGTALVETGSRMDDLIYEEFKGTGNMELHLERKLAERRIFPAINLQRSGTRRDDLLFDNSDYQSIIVMHRMLDMLGDDERTEMVIRRLKETKNNKQFLASLKDG